MTLANATATQPFILRGKRYEPGPVQVPDSFMALLQEKGLVEAPEPQQPPRPKGRAH